MSQFSPSERLIARLLSATPRLKGFIKLVYINVSYIFNRKGYKSRILLNLIREVKLIEPIESADETFFGYYDKSPESGSGWVIFNETTHSTHKKPTSNKPLQINILNLATKKLIPISDTFSYNWQQGCRAQWLDDNNLMFNVFDGGGYKSCVYNINSERVVKIYDKSVQDTCGLDYFLSINYRRVMSLRPDYGYRNQPLMSHDELNDTVNDGIWRIDFSTANETLVLSLDDLIKFSPKSTFKNAYHKVNHVMISPSGQSFIFMHRWYSSGRRHDRLVWSDFSNLRLLSDEEMVSHMCWIDDNTLFGYLRHAGVDGFYFINISTGEFSACKAINDLKSGDGHPVHYNGWIVFDSYPDKSRMQHLYLYNIKSNSVLKLLELFQSTIYQGESRCDLHPRFSPDGSRIYFDTVYSGARRLAFIDVSNITHP